jgi:hypothetical protein
VDRSKYIIIDDGMSETPFLFPEWCNHADVARALVGGMGGEVTRAGFVTITPRESRAGLGVWCSGKSTSLKLQVGKNDHAIIASALGLK